LGDRASRQLRQGLIETHDGALGIRENLGLDAGRESDFRESVFVLRRTLREENRKADRSIHALSIRKILPEFFVFRGERFAAEEVSNQAFEIFVANRVLIISGRPPFFLIAGAGNLPFGLRHRKKRHPFGCRSRLDARGLFDDLSEFRKQDTAGFSTKMVKTHAEEGPPSYKNR